MLTFERGIVGPAVSTLHGAPKCASSSGATATATITADPGGHYDADLDNEADPDRGQGHSEEESPKPNKRRQSSKANLYTEGMSSIANIEKKVLLGHNLDKQLASFLQINSDMMKKNMIVMAMLPNIESSHSYHIRNDILLLLLLL
jgi:hypothetical protein